MRSRLLFLLGLTLLLAVVVAPLPAAAECTNFNSSHAEEFPGVGDSPGCIGTGGGCSECVNYTQSGGSVCVHDFNWANYGCFTWGTGTEFLWV